MREEYKIDEWLIIEEGFNPGRNRASESIFSIGNGYMGQRANFEEKYTGDTLQGSYIAGVYCPDKTKVGWWKNGYPEYFAKVLNAPSWIGINVSVGKEQVDLATSKISSFIRILNMKEGYLERHFRITVEKNKTLDITSKRFLSLSQPDLGLIKYSVKSIDYEGPLTFELTLDADVKNEDTNYGKKFWTEISREATADSGIIVTRTMKTGFQVSTAMCWELYKNKKPVQTEATITNRSKYVSNIIHISVSNGDEIVLLKYANVLSSLNLPQSEIATTAAKRLAEAKKTGYDKLFSDHVNEWEKIWSTSDITIDGDLSVQQAVRFNIFQLNQTYTGKDERLNIGPKGFTGEKYGGSTYWDTEAFALPFFLKTADQKVGRNLLLYRYKHLDKSIANAKKLGFTGGAALYPMVTMNGEECHNEWEITFEEIHRNGAIAYAIFNYIRHTGDQDYMGDLGLEVLIGLSRFWSQRTSFSQNLHKFVILGVTGPNEYENNINNNWYTNTLAVWTLKYTLENLESTRKNYSEKYDSVVSKTGFAFEEETKRWKEIIENMHFPYDKELKVFLQQDGFLDKELIPAASINPDERPINQHWSWDRILRSCYIKQADVLQGLYLFEEKFDTETIKRNFDFYEPLTVHESSLSACIHSIIASRIGSIEKAYALLIRSARLDLDDYNNEISEGLHITSMAGSWLSIVEGFGGMRVQGDKLTLRPLIPTFWKSYSFHARYMGNLFEVKVTQNAITIRNLSMKPLDVIVNDEEKHISASGSILIKTKN